ncbi:MAG: bifunctional hydroxymethylpyrimidine kinase/phosphomethylpyrimidine kinase, partial [Desulfosalsimonadaceae bacterium]|nr:bifunctional hydroxymethylpyrimidine kinase/phosphomethylpyrimidine kinase [Desulfosalsimonadaceae bacterium]
RVKCMSASPVNPLGNPSGIPAVLSIAGSDPSGGAGIQADLKTYTATGVYGAAVITALTAQNTLTVSGVMPVPADFVKQQLDAVLSDIRIDIIKLGMLPNSEICEAIAPYLDKYPVVCDPVMVSTTGCSLINDPAIAALIHHIIPRSDFLTPNLNELAVLCGGKIENMKEIQAAGLSLMARFPGLKGVVLKGGHWETAGKTVTDTLMFREGGRINAYIETNPRYHTKNTHGTGCTFASAFAAFLARKFAPTKAFYKAVAFTNRLIDISKDSRIGKGNGPLLHHSGITLKYPK